jgi:hypothetical protein
MELEALNNLDWTEDKPSIPGFYAFIPESQRLSEYPKVSFVYVDEHLMADSDDWPTWTSIQAYESISGVTGMFALLKSL